MLSSMRSAAKYIWIVIVVAFVGGFLLLDTSGLLGTTGITRSTSVATVNGRDIFYIDWMTASQNMMQRQQEQSGRALTLDEQRRVEDEAFEQMVNDILLQQEYKRRGITVSEQEILQAAQYMPHPDLMQSPELQTEGRFDIEKYQRLLKSPQFKASGGLYQLEAYYRTEIPRQKLLQQVASGVYLTDDRLWRIWQDDHDSAQVTYVPLRPESIPDSIVPVSESDIRRYYDEHKKDFDRPGRAVVSLVVIPRLVTAADTAAARERILALRSQVMGGAKFEDVAKRESADTISGTNGGFLGRGPLAGRFVPEFERAAAQLRPGQISEPVLSQFGFHIIKVDERKADTVALRHIMVRIGQSDSSASRTDRRADSLAAIGAGSDDPARFDSAAKSLALTPLRLVAFEGQPLTMGGHYVPSVSAWAFGGARVGESSDLIDGDDGYYLARLDSLMHGGVPPVEAVSDDIRRLLARQKKLDLLMPRAEQLAHAATTSSLEQAARAQGLTAERSAMFNRLAFVPGIGRLNEAIGSAFALPVGAVGSPVRTDDGVVVLRVDRRVNADRAAWEQQKDAQRASLTQRLREQRVREYLASMRESADVTDNRKKLQAAARQTAS